MTRKKELKKYITANRLNLKQEDDTVKLLTYFILYSIQKQKPRNLKISGFFDKNYMPFTLQKLLFCRGKFIM